MGNCRSSSSLKNNEQTNDEAAMDQQDHNHNLSTVKETKTNDDENSKISNKNASTSALLAAILSVALPTVRRLASKTLIEMGIVLLNEEPVRPTFDINQPNDTLPLKPIGFKVGGVRVVDYTTLRKDMDVHPDFEWPEQDQAEKLMQTPAPGEEAGMIVFDLEKADIEVRFAPGVELIVPVEKFGMKVNIEIGAGGNIEEAWVRFLGPRLRVWFVYATRKLYVSFIDRPDITPYIHVNVDRGRGDFAGVHFTEKGSDLDDVLEKVLSGFGPQSNDASEKEKKSISENIKSSGGTTSWIGNAIGGFVIKAISNFTEMKTNGPLEIDLKDAIESSMDLAFGIPRSADVIREQIRLLEQELEMAEKRENEGVEVAETKESEEEQNLTKIPQPETGAVATEKIDNYSSGNQEQFLFWDKLVCCGGVGSVEDFQQADRKLSFLEINESIKFTPSVESIKFASSAR